MSAFTAKTHRFSRFGETSTVTVVSRATPAEQREMLNRAIIGYDPHHALASFDDTRFLSPVDIQAEKEFNDAAKSAK